MTEQELSSEIQDVFSENMRKRRRALDLTQQEVADRAGLSMAAIQRIETSGRWPGPATFEAICKALEWPAWRFFQVEGMTKIKPSRYEALEVITEAIRGSADDKIPADILIALGKCTDKELGVVRDFLKVAGKLSDDAEVMEK